VIYFNILTVQKPRIIYTGLFTEMYVSVYNIFIALHYLSALGVLSRARDPIQFGLRGLKVIVQEEVD